MYQGSSLFLAFYFVIETNTIQYREIQMCIICGHIQQGAQTYIFTQK